MKLLNKGGSKMDRTDDESYVCKKIEISNANSNNHKKENPFVLPPAEAMEKRSLTKENLIQQNMFRTQGRVDMSHAMEKIRYAARKDKRRTFNALFHHVYNVDHLRVAYFECKKKAAPGIDGVTWKAYGEKLEENLQELSECLKRGAYKAKPVRRAYIPKGNDGAKRALGVTALEDKIVQRVATEVMSAIFETDFIGFSYGFRPKRNQHQALAAIQAGIMKKKVNWILDADIRGYFDSIDHEWVQKFIQHRVTDKRIVRLVQKWLKAAVLEEGQRMETDMGAAQGGSVCPFLSNLYLHFVLDLWTHQWRRKRTSRDIIIVRWADDFIVGFQHEQDARRFLIELKDRFKAFGLELHPEKTRLIEFGRYANSNREARGESNAETFNFLGFTHICGQTRNGKFTVLRKTMSKKMQAKLKEIQDELRVKMHRPIPEVGRWLASILNGHCHYYGVSMNMRALSSFRFRVGRLWFRILKRRSQKSKLTWERMKTLIEIWLPKPKIYNPASTLVK
jgi:group II intron reverse transcriptase/maturase